MMRRILLGQMMAVTLRLSEHMPQPAYNNLCWPQVESDEARAIVFSLFRLYLGETRHLFQTNK
jgi:hypothetical protein